MYPLDRAPLVSALVFWVCILQCFVSSVGYQCAPCTNCTLPKDCIGGLTLDICGCCEVCARVENQTCGGAFNILGKCDEGLECVREVSVGSEIIIGIANNEEGICKAAINSRTTSTTSPCASVNCPVALPCASDSHRVTEDTPHGECCSKPGSCSCNVCNIHRPECPLGKLLRMVRRGENIPGRCCDIYECLDKGNVTEKACMNVACEADPLAGMTCPADSYPLPTLLSQHGCCYIHQGCECLPVKCRQPTCPLGTLVKVVSPGIGKPGFCCEELVCEPDNTTTCMHNDRLRVNGETWDGGNCTQCECKGGLTLCRLTQCLETLECGWTAIQPGECCPVCQGCRAEGGAFHQDGLIWMEDECTMCRCMQGQIFCKTQLCDVHCLRPKKRPGECCASCEDDESRIPSHCANQLLSNCSIHCPNGLLTDNQGCPTCQCKPSCELHCPFGYMTDFEGNDLCECRRRNYCPPLINCQKRCRHGYKLGANGCQVCQCLKCPDLSMCWIKCPSGLVIDQQGCTICQCKETAVTEALPAGSTTPSDVVCMSTTGRGHRAGQTWFDGCRMCSCIQGVEMCSLITCPTPRCSQPILRGGDCCHSCPGEPIGPLPTSSPHCPNGGDSSKQNELWQLDSCTRCVCHGAAILCEEERCPPLLCHHPVKTPHTCCPQCADERSVIPSPGLVPGRGCKSLSGVNYSDGEVWRTNPCQSCACINGQVHCFSQTCPVLSCNETVLRKGQCCPVCQTGDHGVCVHEGKIFTSGQHWNLDECYHCMCLWGEKQCVQLRCEAYTPSQCSHLFKIPGQCCSICLNGSSTIPPVRDKTTALSSGTEVPNNEEGGGLQSLVAVLVTILILLIILVTILVIIVLWQRRRRRRERTLYENPQNVMDNRSKTPIPYPVIQTLPLFQNINKQNMDNEKRKKYRLRI